MPTTTTAKCASYSVIQGSDGTSTNITYLYGNASRSLFVRYASPGATTYITDTDVVCGPRCARVWVFQSLQPASGVTSLSVMDCNVTVTDVENASLPQHEVPDEQARIAAGAIGLEGVAHENDSKQFATGVIAAAGELNPLLSAPGSFPSSGERLTVEWRNVCLILGLLALAHLLIFTIMIGFATSVVVKKNSHLAIAELLEPLVKRVSPSDRVRDEDISGENVLYGVKMSQAGSGILMLLRMFSNVTNSRPVGMIQRSLDSCLERSASIGAAELENPIWAAIFGCHGVVYEIWMHP
ncbi:hypothetical protein GP486_006222 [Trichoglossum hirsutum]|uniref:Uncharacterized protein n=1 Tax=Trichoglossum hirsutum TaxID=265104 RepID=A0A9P8IIW1_9PEZI|nr:hypothetical protein GP486_006222 [Trichoglossum hirsutum]